MNIISDGIAVLGSRIGFVWDPPQRKSYLVRHGSHPGIPLNIRAGIKLEDKTVYFPLVKEESFFEFLDQKTTPTTMVLSGIDPKTGIHARITVRIPFRPLDYNFSTVPVIIFDVEAERLSSQFRWTESSKDEKISGSLFVEISGEGMSIKEASGNLEVCYDSLVKIPETSGLDMEGFDSLSIKSRDIVVPLEGIITDGRVSSGFNLARGDKGCRVSLAWCVYDLPVLNVLGDRCPFLYSENFASVEDVAKWAMENSGKVRESNSKTDYIFNSHSLGDAVSSIMAYALHSWLVNTWLVKRPSGQKWFSVWEGSCYFHSTVDVEYTQSPFYLSVWPELLGLQLDEWPLFGKDASDLLGERGMNKLFLSHDIGYLTECTRQYYPHEMEVEENSNYIQLAFLYWRRTGDDSLIRKHETFITKLLDFILACDTTGNGIPDKGCANTIDDASPAIQFGSEQVYLGVKAMTAVKCGAEILKHLGRSADSYNVFVEKAVKTIETLGWVDDHYVVTLTRTLDGIINPWSGEMMNGELEGWDAYHIYTSNGLALMEMVGFKTDLDRSRLKSDLKNSFVKTKGKYGCRHTSYVNTKPTNLMIPGLAGSAPEVGWISMNMLRDIAAAYHGLDFSSVVQNYWDWQLTTNSQGVYMFFETFYGNNLNFYPRGLAVFGYAEAFAGFSFDKCSNSKNYKPIKPNMTVPLYCLADWQNGSVPLVITGDADGQNNFLIKDNKYV